MKKIRKSEWIPYAVLAGAAALLAALNFLCQDHWLDSDMAAEMMFSKLLAEENRLFASPEWYYSSEFRVLYTQLAMTPLFHFLTDWGLVRAVTNLLFYALLAGSYFYMAKPLKLKRKWAAWSCAVLLLPFSETLMTHMQMGNTYMPHVILLFLAFGLFLRLGCGDGGRGRRAVRLFLYGGLCLVFGLSGVRYLLALLCPLVLAAVWGMLDGDAFRALRAEVSLSNGKAFLRQEKAAYAWHALAGAFLAVLGYGVNVFLLADRFSFQTYETVNFIPVFKGVFLERLQNTLGSFLMLFGYISDKSVLSLRGLVTVAAVALILLGVYFVRRSGKLLREEERECARAGKETGYLEARKLTRRFFLSAFALNTFVFLFTDSTVVDRYYITSVVFVLPLIAVYFEREKMPFDRLFTGILLAGCLFLSTAKTVYSFVTVDKNGEKRAVAAFLEDNGYRFGYATYWNANIVTELTDGQVEVANIMEPPEEGNGEFAFFKWSSPARYYTEEAAGEASFLLLSEEERETFKEYEAVKAGQVVYEDEYYTVFGYGR